MTRCQNCKRTLLDLAYDQHQDEYGCVPTQCFKYGDGPHYL